MINSFTGEYRWLSNFFPVEVSLEGIIFPSVEHAYQASKTLNIEDRIYISKLSVREAKRHGRWVTLRPHWSEWNLRVQTMESLLSQKFEFPYLRNKLLSTGSEELVEGNWWGDIFWGVCGRTGRNELGKLLMSIREGIKQ